MPELKKTTYMRLLERLHPGKTINQIVTEACQNHPTPEGAASELGVSMTTLRNWKREFGMDAEEPAEALA